MMKKHHYFVFLLCTLMVISACGIIVAHARAAWGRPDFHGYFDGQLHSWGYNPGSWPDNGYVLPPNSLNDVNSVDSLISVLQYYNTHGDPFRSTSAFIVDTMLGRDGQGAPKDISSADWTDLRDRLNNVSINWDTSYSTSFNTYHMSTAIHSYDSRANSANDVGVAESGQASSHVIVMSKDGATVYALFRSCANPAGNLPGLPTAPPKIVPKGSCSTLAIKPDLPEPGQTFDLTATINYGKDEAAVVAASGSSFYLKLNGTDVVFSKSLSGDSYTLTANGQGPAKAGNYTVNWGVAGSVGPVDCSGNFIAAYHPYFTAIGGDVVAGAGYISPSGCHQDTAAVIKSWNNDVYPYFGAASELASLALGKISNFASATNPGDGSTTVGQGNRDPNNLSFANTVNPAGQLGGLACMPDYYSQAQSTGPSNKTSLSGIASWPTGTYQINGPATLGSAGIGLAIPADGRRLTVLVNGDLYVTGKSITYASAKSIQDIPRLTLIVKGDIYISNTITELHGAYIAQPNNASTGNVYTCAVMAAAGKPNVANNYTDCGGIGLTIYGALSAQNLNLGRSLGGLAAKQPAETFQFTPELWLGGGTQFSANNTGYDSITSLPPTL